MDIRLKHINSFVDRHGRRRNYLRLPGKKSIELKSPPGTMEFVDEYQHAVERARSTKPSPGAKLVKSTEKHTIGYLILNYRKSRRFLDLNPSTRRVRNRMLDRIAARIGQHSFAEISRLHIKKWRDAPEGAEAGNLVVKTLRQVFALAVEDDLMAHNVAMDVSYRKGNPEGWEAWTIEDVEKFIKTHPKGTMAYKAMCFLLFTGQRISDVYRFGPQHVTDDWLIFTQQKNKSRKPVRLELPIIAPLKEVLDQPPAGQMAFIVSLHGRPFSSSNSFGNWFRRQARQAGIYKPNHGIRKGLGDILASMGLTAHQIMAILGHSTLKQAELYTRRADRRRLAGEGMKRLETELKWNETYKPSSKSG